MYGCLLVRTLVLRAHHLIPASSPATYSPPCLKGRLILARMELDMRLDVEISFGCSSFISLCSLER